MGCFKDLNGYPESPEEDRAGLRTGVQTSPAPWGFQIDDGSGLALCHSCVSALSRIVCHHLSVWAGWFLLGMMGTITGCLSSSQMGNQEPGIS